MRDTHQLSQFLQGGLEFDEENLQRFGHKVRTWMMGERLGVYVDDTRQLAC